MAAAALVSFPFPLRRAVQALVTAIPTSGAITHILHLPSSPSLRRLSWRRSAFGMCHLAQAIKDDNDILLKGVGDKVSSEDVKHIIEMAKRASLRHEVLHTDFLTPPVLKESMLIVEKLADVKTVAQGGYPEAERCRLSVGHPEALTTEPDVVSALSISGNFGFQPCSHGDFLGAILGTGIAREKLGDILLQVGNVPVTCKRMPLIALEYKPPSTKTFKTVEASLRIDAIASAGFKISRSKLVSLISDGDVRVNWTTVTKNNTTVKAGDIISVSGKGRVKVGEVNSTKKGKYAVELIRYL